MFQNALLDRLVKLYTLFIKTGSNLQSLLLFYMRITWGLQFFLTGWGKLHNIENVIQFFTALHIPYPAFHAYLVAIVEASCGFLLFVGLASRLAALPLIITMLAALSIAHSSEISNFRFLLEPMSLVKQAPYPFLVTALMVFAFGPGRISLDGWLKRWVSNQPKY